MEQLSRDDALDFYKRFYGPNDAVVVIAGDIEPDAALKLAQDTYGKVKPVDGIKKRQRPQEPPQVSPRSLTLADPRVEQPVVQRNYLVPSFATAKAANRPGQSEALELLAHILGAGSNSRMYKAMVVDKHVAVGAGAYYDSSALDMAKFGFYGSPSPGVTLPQVEAAADEVIAQVIANGVTAEELERAKSRLVADAIYAQDNQASMARWYGGALMSGATVEDVRQWPARIRAVTAQQVQDAAREWLDKKRSVTGYLIKDTAAPSGQPASLQPVKAEKKS
jgi:zinc protease